MKSIFFITSLFLVVLETGFLMPYYNSLYDVSFSFLIQAENVLYGCPMLFSTSDKSGMNGLSYLARQ